MENEQQNKYDDLYKKFLSLNVPAKDLESISFSHSQYKKIWDDLFYAAKSYKEAEKISFDEFEKFLEGNNYLIDGLRNALNEKELEEIDITERYKIWTYTNGGFQHSGILNRIKNTGKKPYIERFEIEATVGEYLKMPYRSQRMDRILVDVLIAMELAEFAHSMFYPDKYGPGSPLKATHPILLFLIGTALNAAIFIGLAFGAEKIGWEIAAIILVGLFFLLFIISIITTPLACWRHYKNKKTIINLLLAMDSVYRELNSSGPISARHIQELAEIATTKGAVWPAPLFSLLDDIRSRTGRF